MLRRDIQLQGQSGTDKCREMESDQELQSVFLVAICRDTREDKGREGKRGCSKRKGLDFLGRIGYWRDVRVCGLEREEDEGESVDGEGLKRSN